MSRYTIIRKDQIMSVNRRTELAHKLLLSITHDAPDLVLEFQRVHLELLEVTVL